jgi:hypothetical protein
MTGKEGGRMAVPSAASGAGAQAAPLAAGIKAEGYPTRTFRADRAAGRIRGMADGLEAMAQAVEIALSVERYKFQIYTANAGVELQGLVGQDAEFAASELQRRVADAFVPDPRVLGVDGFEFEFPEPGSMRASFTVRTAYGDVGAGMEVPI